MIYTLYPHLAVLQAVAWHFQSHRTGNPAHQKLIRNCWSRCTCHNFLVNALSINQSALAKLFWQDYNASMPHIPEVELYEKIGAVAELQPDHMVCGRSITREPPYPNVATYQGRVIVFCTRYCLEAFEADPDRFFAAHSRPAEDRR